jgi:hypothetical protein
MQLTQGMYGSEFRNTGSMFGIRCGQMRGQDIVHNGGWYNAAGEKLGWGDMSADDFLRISSELPEGELFVVLPESASFWKFVDRKRMGMIGSMHATSPDIEAPGVDFIVEHAMWIIARSRIYGVSHTGTRGVQTHFQGNMVFEAVGPAEAGELIRAAAIRYSAGLKPDTKSTDQHDSQ